MSKQRLYRYVLIYNGPEKAKEDLLVKYIDYIMQTPNFLDVDLEYKIGDLEVSKFYSPNFVRGKNDLWKINSVFSGTYFGNYTRKGHIVYPEKLSQEQIETIKSNNFTFSVNIKNSRIKRKSKSTLGSEYTINYKGNNLDLFKEAYKIVQIMDKKYEDLLKGVSIPRKVKYVAHVQEALNMLNDLEAVPVPTEPNDPLPF